VEGGTHYTHSPYGNSFHVCPIESFALAARTDTVSAIHTEMGMERLAMFVYLLFLETRKMSQSL
jgi:hypothetical protein